MRKSVFFIFMKKHCLLISSLCISVFTTNAQTSQYQDEATRYTISAIAKQAASGKIMFGVANGVSRSYNNTFGQHEFFGDCKAITGKDPQFVENDFLFNSENGFFTREVQAAKASQANGALIGYCWHLESYTSKSFRKSDADSALVSKIVSEEPSPEKTWYYSLLDTLVTPVFRDLGFPVVFRPFHEMNGGWFWWGSECTTPEQYIKLYRATVDRLRNNGLRNVIYCWSPDTYLKMEYYPGDDYVDIMALDVYEPGCSPYHPNNVYVDELNNLLKTAKQHGKIAALSETGLREYDGVMRYPEEIPDFWTSKVFAPILNKKGKGNGIAYVMSWYNANWHNDNRGSLYIPYPGIEKVFGQKGSMAIDDFKKLASYKNVLFCGDSNRSIYQKK